MVADGRNQPGHLGPESILELTAVGGRIFEHIVKDSRCNHVVGIARAFEDRCRLERMDQKRGAIALPGVARMALAGEGDGLLGQRKAAVKAQFVL